MPAPEIQALLGMLLAEIKQDALALDPYPPAATTLIHFDEWSKTCFGKGFDPSTTGLQRSMFVSDQSHGYLLTFAALVERDLGACEIESDKISSLHEHAEDLLRELRSDTALPSDLRLRLIHSLTEVAESLRIYRATGAHGVETATNSLVSTMATSGNNNPKGLLRKVADLARYLALVLRVGQAAADLIEGNVDGAIEGAMDITHYVETGNGET